VKPVSALPKKSFRFANLKPDWDSANLLEFRYSFDLRKRHIRSCSLILAIRFAKVYRVYCTLWICFDWQLMAHLMIIDWHAVIIVRIKNLWFCSLSVWQHC